jgi:hypothetical protein
MGILAGASGLLWLKSPDADLLECAVCQGEGIRVWHTGIGCLSRHLIEPIVGRYSEKEDWQRSRYAWVRIGYDHVVHTSDGNYSSAEDRGILSMLHKIGLPEEIWLEARERADLRWMGGEYSTRYRLRLEATREFMVFGHSVVPYLNAEGYYDTRYVGLARMLYMAGSEFTFTDHFRCELYFAQQTDYRPNASGVAVLGVVAKWYY